MKIGLACDHAGFSLKQFVKRYLEEKGLEYEDFGCFSEESCDYPDFAHRLGYAIDRGTVKTGIAICGSGEGISMTLNKHPRVRAALVWMPQIAVLARQHNDANVLAMPGRFISEGTAREIMDAFLSTPFEGGRHERRIKKIPLPGNDPTEPNAQNQ